MQQMKPSEEDIAALDNRDWFNEQGPAVFRQYAGEWICISQKHVVYHHPTMAVVMREAGKYKDAFLTRIRKPGMYVL